MSTHQIKWAEINLDKLAENVKKIRGLVGEDVKIAAVVKANAYGHGVFETAEVLLDNGADMLAVSSVNEAVEIIEKYKWCQILVLGYTNDEKLKQAISYGVIHTVINKDQAEKISEMAEELGLGASIHLKIDTGMNRIGFKIDDDIIDIIDEIFHMPNIQVNGIFSHFAVADESDKAFSELQYDRFKAVVEALEARGIKIPMKHISNSAGIIDLPEYRLNMVRAGVMLYGVYPSNEVNKGVIDLEPVMALKTRIINVKTLNNDEGISYGLKHVAKKGTVVGTIPIGYADGYPRSLSKNGEVLIRGLRAKVIGTVCMDQCMIDITDVKNVGIGDEVTIFGEGLPIDEIADKCNTISYEIMCNIGRRVPRVYISKGKIVKETNYLNHFEG